MNSQHLADRALAGIHSMGEALLTISKAGESTAGPDNVDQQRLAFEVHIQEARTQFGHYFAELIATHPVTPQREREEALARAEA